MERHRAPSQASVDRKSNAFKENSIASINKQNQLQNEIDNLIQHGLLEPIVAYDPKLDFSYVPIITRDQAIKQIRRQTSGLIWNSIRPPAISKLIHEDRSCAFVEILRPPTNWSRYDTDLLLVKIRQKNFLNGLTLRDEFVRVLQIILKRDFQDEKNPEKKFTYEFKDVDFTRNMIQLIFHSRQDNEITLIISLVLLVEFDVPCMEFFPDAFTSLSLHVGLNEYLKCEPDMNRTRLTPYNSIKFLFDYSLTEANLCEYVSQKTNPLSPVFTNFLKLRKEWIKHVQRAAKYATDTVKLQMHPEKHRQSSCSVNSGRSITSTASTMNKLLQNKLSLSGEIEAAFESIFSVSLVRLLFLTICSKYKQFGSDHDNDITYAIEKALQLFSESLESNYLEHPLFKNTNILPDSLLTHDISIKIGIKKLVKEMHRDWKRNIRR